MIAAVTAGTHTQSLGLAFMASSVFPHVAFFEWLHPFEGQNRCLATENAIYHNIACQTAI
jgi:hypothetical protein